MKLKLYYVCYKYEGTELLDMISGPHYSYMRALEHLNEMDIFDHKNVIIVFNESEVTKA